ncbi:MAG: hypothetical protein H9W81_21925 [Enterococcus sp.]|nr:hypothetical protein [Enterococcus sp.]
MTFNEEATEDESWMHDLDSDETVVDEEYVSPLASGSLESAEGTDDTDNLDFDFEDETEEPLEGVLVAESADTELAEFEPDKPLSVEEAQELTEHIRSTADVLYVLVARAHAGKAHIALGYKNFESYVKEEFNISRSRAYQFLNQANVIAAVESAAPEGTKIRITEAAARDLKNFVDELTPAIKERTEGLSPNDAGEVVEEIVSDFRDRAKKPVIDEAEEFDIEDFPTDDDDELFNFDNEGGSNSSGGGSEFDKMEDFENLDGILDEPIISDDVEDPSAMRKNIEMIYAFYNSMTALAQMPDFETIVDTIPDTRKKFIDSSLPKALAWLTTANEVWASRKDVEADSDDDADIDFDFSDDEDVSEEEE